MLKLSSIVEFILDTNRTFVNIFPALKQHEML